MHQSINVLFNLGDDLVHKDLSISFLIDLSGSMQGTTLEKVKEALIQILKPLTDGSNSNYSTAEEVNLLTFHDKVKRICPWIKQEDFDFFKECLFSISDQVFSDSGCTALHDGVYEALKLFKKSNPNNEHVLIVFSDGGENSSSRSFVDIEELSKQLSNGFVLKSDISSIMSSYDSEVMESLFVKSNDNDVLIFNPKLEDSPFWNAISNEHKSILFRFRAETSVSVKIYSLYYEFSDNTSDKRHKRLLERYAALNQGKVFDVSNENKIPEVLDEILRVLTSGKSDSVRSELLHRLTSCEYSRKNVGNWFRVISVNYGDNDSKFFTSELNRDHKTYENSVYYLQSLHSNNNEIVTKAKILEKFREKFVENLPLSLETDLLTNLNVLNQGGANARPILNFVFRGQDLLAISLMTEFLRIIQATLDRLQNSAHLINIIILADNWHLYGIEEKRLLKSLLYELELVFEGDVNNILFVSDRNDSRTNEELGYRALKMMEFQDSVVNVLYNINVNQDIVGKMNSETVRVGEDFQNKYFSIGSISMEINIQEVINAYSALFFNKFTTELFDNTKIRIDEPAIEASINLFGLDYFYSGAKKALIKSTSNIDLIALLECPESIKFSEYKKIILLKISQLVDDDLLKKEVVYKYASETEYITHLIFDLKDYIDSSLSMSFFEQKVNLNLDNLINQSLTDLRDQTDQNFFKAPDISSPLQAEVWLNKLLKRIERYLENEIGAEFQGDPDYQKQVDFFPSTSSKIDLKNKDPKTYFDKLIEKVQGFPLAISVRMKYYSLALMLLVGGVSVAMGMDYSSMVLISSLIPALIFIVICEYKISQSKRQIRELIRLYKEVRENKAKLSAYQMLLGKVKSMLESIKDAISKDYQVTQVEAGLSELTFIEFFREALNGFAKTNYTEKKFLKDSPFFINAFKRFGLEHVLEDDYYLNKTSDRFLREKYLQSDFNFTCIHVPRIVSKFLPPNFQTLDPVTRIKFDIVRLDENCYHIYLLDGLSDSELTTVRNLYESKIWNNIVDELVQSYNQHLLTPNRTAQLFSLWREISQYQAWLHKLKLMPPPQIQDEIKFDKLFEIWKRIFSSRRQFKKYLLEMIQEDFAAAFNKNNMIWEIVSRMPELLRSELFRTLVAYSYPAVKIMLDGDNFPAHTKFYLSNDFNKGVNIKTDYHYDLDNFLGPQTINFINDDESNYLVSFLRFVRLPWVKEVIITNDLLNIRIDELLKEKNLYFSQEVLDSIKERKISKSNDPFLKYSN